jgi:hypothetical protein
MSEKVRMKLILELKIAFKRKYEGPIDEYEQTLKNILNRIEIFVTVSKKIVP